MCLRIRQEQTELKASGTTLTPPGSRSLRPRWVGAAALALVGGFAAAALLMPSSMQSPPTATATQSAAPALPGAEKTAGPSIAQEQAATASPIVFEQTISGDDGVPTNSVPTNTDVAGTVAGGCRHEL